MLVQVDYSDTIGGAPFFLFILKISYSPTKLDLVRIGLTKSLSFYQITCIFDFSIFHNLLSMEFPLRRLS